MSGIGGRSGGSDTVTVSGAVTVSGTVTANQGTAGATPWLVQPPSVAGPLFSAVASSNVEAQLGAAPGATHTYGTQVTAPIANSAPVYIGLTGVSTATGDELIPGASRFYPCTRDKLYVISTAAQAVRVVAL